MIIEINDELKIESIAPDFLDYSETAILMISTCLNFIFIFN